MKRPDEREGEAPVEAAAYQTAAPAAGAGWLVPLIIGSAMLMQTLNATVITNALPTMAHALGVDPLRLNLAITLYLLAQAVFLPISGWAADKWGAKQVFLAAIIVFTVSSAACGFATNLVQLVLARFVQGIGAAMMVPVGRLVLLRTTPKSEITGALSVIMIPALFGPMFGPLIGGFIVTYWNWRWIFFVNLPLALAGIALVIRYIPQVAREAVPPLDWRGLLLAGFGLTGLIFGFDGLGNAEASPAVITGCLAGGLAGLGLFVLHAGSRTQALLDLSLFRIQTFRVSVIGGSFMRISMVATPFMLAMLLQIGFGMTPIQAGFLTLMTSLGALVMKAAAPPILRTFGFRGVLVFDSVIAAGFMMANGLFTPTTPHWLIMAVLMVGGFFRSLQFTAFNGLTFADIEPAQMSRAATLSSTAQQVIQSLGVGLAAMILHVLMMAHGEAKLTAETVAPAFFIIGGVSMLAVLFTVRLAKDAGSELHPAARPGR